jgi:hypothetical protein
MAALVDVLVCVAASCGLATSGLEETAREGGASSKGDASAAKDGGTKRDAVLGDDALADSGKGDGRVGPDVAQGGDSPSEDGQPAVDAPPEGPPTCTGCTATQCCKDGVCTDVGNTSCADPGQACVDCTTSPRGNQCLMLNAHQTCGCSGPNSPDQCPMNNACHNQQCGTSCDGQHPCNGGCCSGNLLFRQA